MRREKPAIPKSSKKILAESQRATSQSRNPSFLKRSEQLLEEKRAQEAAAAQRELQESQRVSAKKSVDRCAHSLVSGSLLCLIVCGLYTRVSCRPTDAFLARADAWERQKRCAESAVRASSSFQSRA